MTAKTIDRIAVKREGSLRVQDLLRGKTPEEQLQYWRERTDLLRPKAQ